MKVSEQSLLGDRCRGFQQFRDLDKVELMPVKVREKLSETKSSVEQLLDSIYEFDPVTGLPSCDISVFMNSNTSDSVRKFIQDNLMSDNGVQADSSNYPDLPDSVIADYMRRSDESIYQYRDRVIGLMRQNYAEYSNKDKND